MNGTNLRAGHTTRYALVRVKRKGVDRQMQRIALRPQLPDNVTRTRKLDDPLLRAKILAAIHEGSYRYQACAYARIGYQVFVEYLKLDTDFADQVAQAEATRAVASVSEIILHGKKDWRALAWFLERKFPDEWGRRDRLAVTGKDGGPLQIEDLPCDFDLARLSDHEYDVLKMLVAKIDERLQAQLPPRAIRQAEAVNGNGNGNGTGDHA